MIPRPLLFFLGCAAFRLALAAEDAPRLSPDGAAALAQGLSLQQEAARSRTEADTRLTEENAACQHRFLVNGCIADAKKRHLETLRRAREMEAEGRDLEYQARTEERALKEAQRASDAAARTEALPQQEADVAARRAARALQRDKRLADKAAEARTGEKRVAARKTAYAKKQALHEKKLKKAAQNPRKKPDILAP
ncbi:MAG: hypothetical protein LBR88_04700 [Zoogloeaceae bacterium]|jgi:hypothetical protein|nr:hypothetical protein [Zoogloeaceae bacterium]